MTAVRSKSWKSLAFVTALMTVLALLPFMPSAQAVHDTRTLDIGSETAENPSGAFHTLTATISGDPAPHDAEIDFEVDCTSSCAGVSYTRTGTTGEVTGNAARAGGPVSAFDTPTDGDQSSGTVDDTRDTPELSCTVPAGQTSCQVSYSRTGAGNDLIAGWIDVDETNSATDSDTAEGRNEATAPGNTTEPDRTDVVSKDWFADVAANAAINCVDESGDDAQDNPPGQSETYTCTIFSDTNTNAVKDAGEAAIAGVVADAEISGANDPDNSDFSAASNLTADVNNAGTSDANGQFTYVLAASENETGTAKLCFWIDADGDSAFDPTGDNANDGGMCNNEDAGVETTNLRTDVLTKNWVAPTPSRLEATPELDNNASGTSHTVTATVTDQYGGAAANVPVDFVIDAGSRNAALGTICNNVLTNASGVATCTYSDAGSSTTSGFDNIRVSQDSVTDATEGRDESATAGGTAEPDRTDVVRKDWTAGGPPAAGSVVVDMLPAADGADAGGETCDDPEDSTDAAEVGSWNPFCGEVLTAASAEIAGKDVTLTLSGPGTFSSGDADADGVLDANENLGTTTTVTTNESGEFNLNVYSKQAGNATITATVDGKTDTATKTWTPGQARNIACDPETATNPPGTSHIITCTATDRYGNPTNQADDDGAVDAAGDFVTVSESGPGRIDNTDADAGIGSAAGTQVALATDGTAEVIVSTTANETGTQSITAEIVGDTGDVDGAADLDDACDQASGTAAGYEPGPAGTGQADAPAGNCETTVEKIWEEEPVTQCSDGVDNDGDGWVDFPDDPGCDDAADDDESNEPIVTNHARTAEITKFKHIDLPGKKKPALMVKGVVTVDDGFDACANQVPVKVQIRASGEWITRKTDSTSENGVFKVLVRHVHAKYRVVAPAVDLTDEHGDIDHCLKAKDGANYDH